MLHSCSFFSMYTGNIESALLGTSTWIQEVSCASWLDRCLRTPLLAVRVEICTVIRLLLLTSSVTKEHAVGKAIIVAREVFNLANY